MAAVAVDLRTLKETIAQIAKEIDDLCGLEQIIEVGNRVDLGQVYDDTAAVGVANRILWSLLRELALVTTRLLDPPRGDRASLPRVFRDLRDQALRSALIDAEGVRLRAAGRDASELLDDVTGQWAAFVNGAHLGGSGAMHEARNAYQAHDLLTPVAPLPGYGELYGALHAIRPIVKQLGVLTGVHPDGFDGTIATWRERAVCFWQAQLQIKLAKARGGLAAG